MGESGEMVIQKFREAIDSGDVAAFAAMLNDWTTDDFLQEWPQSGERIRGREAARKLTEGYESATGTSPRMKLRRISGGGDLYVIEGTIDYGDGTPVSYVGVAELRDGRVAKMTEYFANPFEAPAWRAALVERMEPASV